MLYSASRRTDMPAFHPDAIVDKVGRSRRLEGLVLWTKDIRNTVRHPGLRRVLLSVPTVVQYTVTGLAGTAWEPGVPPLDSQLDALAELGALLPRGAVRWRFDPVMPGPDLRDRFVAVKSSLESALGPVRTVTVSFPDPYRHAVSRSEREGLSWPRIGGEEKRRIVRELAACFDAPADVPVRLCCEPELLRLPGVGMARCVDGGLFARLYGLPLAELPKDGGQRVACGCAKSTDIGSYAMPCGHGCRYCYARKDDGLNR